MFEERKQQASAMDDGQECKSTDEGIASMAQPDVDVHVPGFQVVHGSAQTRTVCCLSLAVEWIVTEAALVHLRPSRMAADRSLLARNESRS